MILIFKVLEPEYYRFSFSSSHILGKVLPRNKVVFAILLSESRLVYGSPWIAVAELFRNGSYWNTCAIASS